MGNIKLFAKNEKELETLIQALTIYSQDIGMEFIIDKCTILMWSGKQHMTERIKLPNKKELECSEKKKHTHAWGGARGVMVIVVGIGHSDTSSNPGLIAFHIALIPLGKVRFQ